MHVMAESEVRGSLDVLKVIFMDHTFQPRAAETLGNLRCLLGASASGSRSASSSRSRRKLVANFSRLSGDGQNELFPARW